MITGILTTRIAETMNTLTMIIQLYGLVRCYITDQVLVVLVGLVPILDLELTHYSIGTADITPGRALKTRL